MSFGQSLIFDAVETGRRKAVFFKKKKHREGRQVSSLLYSVKEILLTDHIEGSGDAGGCEEDGIEIFLQLMF